ncbi:Extracellular metalloproteinase 10 [Hypsizygus marmoreus]|uniref:Extracellular metalloproteinase n=1 Tax=Hypsizygus marmoreus TaxID=39966 RepID=A0A369JAX2_HYPMA|nr:Extracellular metalloproteinase 10 [Hypsizygus marmoreus]
MHHVVIALFCVSVVAAHLSPGHTRKSLSIGTPPQTKFISPFATLEIPRVAIHQDKHTDALDAAKRFIENELISAGSFDIRPDSYTDKSTGVTHVYARQVVNDLEVIDGDINVNVKDGAAISYGQALYLNDKPTQLPSEILGVGKEEQYGATDGQTVMDAKPLLGSHLASSIGSSSMKAALLQFMLEATPLQTKRDDILDNYDSHLARMSITVPQSFNPSTRRRTVAITNVPDAVSPVKAYLAYAQVSRAAEASTRLELVWKFEVEMHDNWYEAAVSASPPHSIISVVDWVADSPIKPAPSGELATYNVFGWGINDPEEGSRSIETETPDVLASPLGWHSLPVANDPSLNTAQHQDDPLRNTTTTYGNNVFAHENWAAGTEWINNLRPDGGKHKIFDFKYAPQPGNQSGALEEARAYINASVAQAFYISNLLHDLFYRYGFDEASGNFQQSNFERGGRENDGVILDVQDGSGMNNANFATPPDGENGRCKMYLWNTAYPWRDASFDAGVLIHELSHGLASRLTGGPANSACIGFGESSGMGEGWSDLIATLIRSKPNVTAYNTGAWIGNNSYGQRHYPYSLDNTTNPLTYKTLNSQPYNKEVHAMGEVWAEILWVVAQRLIAQHGFSESLFPPQPLANGTIPTGEFYRPATFTAEGTRQPLVPKHGNSLILQLLINGMKLQPCRPSFFQARDAIIQADQVLTGGENFCTLWHGFAERGLGRDSRYDGKTPWGGGVRKDGFAVPTECTAIQNHGAVGR